MQDLKPLHNNTYVVCVEATLVVWLGLVEGLVAMGCSEDSIKKYIPEQGQDVTPKTPFQQTP